MSKVAPAPQTPQDLRVPFDDAEAYQQAGWSGTLALPSRAKKPPPEGFTGEAGKWPLPADLARWRAEGRTNLAIRLPHGVIGLDVDCYADKPGKETLLALVSKLGTPPPTWTSTSRRDGSGIRWYRAPAKIRDWPTEAGPGIEIIRYGHRYAVVPPSIHEEGRRYVWLKPDGTRAQPCELPSPGDLPELPASWIAHLTGVDTATGERKARPGSRAEQRERHKKAQDWIAGLPGGEPCDYVAKIAADVYAAARREDGSAYDHTRDAMLALLGAGSRGHFGAPGVIEEALPVYVATVSDTRDARTATAEFQRFTLDGAAKLMAEPQDREYGCDCGDERTKQARVSRRESDNGRSRRGSPPRRGEAVRASDVRPTPTFWAWQDRIPIGALSLIVGVPGLGKTLLLVDLAAKLSRGELFGEFAGEPHNSLLMSTEDAIDNILVPRLIAADADLDRVFFFVVREGEDEVGVTLPDDLLLLAERIESTEAKLVGIDPVMGHLGDQIDSHRDHEVRRALSPLGRLANRQAVAVAGIGHLNKAPGKDLYRRIGGSIGFGAAARSVLLVTPDPQKPSDDYARVIVHGKTNYGKFAPTIKAYTEGATVEGHDGREINTQRIVLGDEVAGLRAADVLGEEPDSDNRDKVDDASEFLAEVLKDGPVCRPHLTQIARKDRVANITLRRAKAARGDITITQAFRGQSALWMIGSVADNVLECVQCKAEKQAAPIPQKSKQSNQMEVLKNKDLTKVAQGAHGESISNHSSAESFPCTGGCGARFPEPDTMCFTCKRSR